MAYVGRGFVWWGYWPSPILMIWNPKYFSRTVTSAWWKNLAHCYLDSSIFFSQEKSYWATSSSRSYLLRSYRLLRCITDITPLIPSDKPPSSGERRKWKSVEGSYWEVGASAFRSGGRGGTPQVFVSPGEAAGRGTADDSQAEG